ncbi:MAG: AraC family transcriptional regulator [Sphingobium sp.]
MRWSLSEFLNELELRGQTWCVVECDDAGGFSVPPDDRLRFYAVLEGGARIAGLGGPPLGLNAGEIAIILSGEAHAVRARPDSRTTIIDFMREGSYDDEPPTLRLGDGGPVATRLLCGRLKVRWPGGVMPHALPPLLQLGPDDPLVGVADLARCAAGVGAAGLLTRIAATLLAQALQRHAAGADDFPASIMDDPVARAVQVIDQHPAQPWTVSSLAQKIGMGRSNFATRFASMTGSTPMEMLAERRMQMAEDLLRQRGSLKIVEIATRVGYRSEAAFIRRFVRQFGITPGVMRSRAARP